MHASNYGKDKLVNDDEVAMSRLRELKMRNNSGEVSYTAVARVIGVSDSLVSRVANYPNTCTLWTYKRLAEYFRWEGYMPGRKLNVTAKQGVIPFMEFTSRPESRSEYDIREIADAETIEALKVIARTLHKTYDDTVARALKLYIHDCRRILDYAGDSPKCAM